MIEGLWRRAQRAGLLDRIDARRAGGDADGARLSATCHLRRNQRDQLWFAENSRAPKLTMM
jgi:hypothetical protein